MKGVKTSWLPPVLLSQYSTAQRLYHLVFHQWLARLFLLCASVVLFALLSSTSEQFSDYISTTFLLNTPSPGFVSASFLEDHSMLVFPSDFDLHHNFQKASADVNSDITAPETSRIFLRPRRWNWNANPLWPSSPSSAASYFMKQGLHSRHSRTQKSPFPEASETSVPAQDPSSSSSSSSSSEDPAPTPESATEAGAVDASESPAGPSQFQNASDPSPLDTPHPDPPLDSPPDLEPPPGGTIPGTAASATGNHRLPFFTSAAPLPSLTPGAASAEPHPTPVHDPPSESNFTSDPSAPAATSAPSVPAPESDSPLEPHPHPVSDAATTSSTPPPAPPSPLPPIRGLHLSHQKEVELRAAVSCMSGGEWVRNPHPRRLPWTPEGYFGICDITHAANHTGGIFGEKADRVAVEGGVWQGEEWVPRDGDVDGDGDGEGGEREEEEGRGWNVRPSLKWEWKADGGCRWQHFQRMEMCRVLDRVGNLLLVGDSIQDELERSIYNALYMDQPEDDHPTAWPQEEHPDWNDSQKTVLYPRPLSYCHMSLLYEEERPEEFEWLADGWTSLGGGRETRRPKRAEERSKIRFVRNDHLSMPESAVEFEAPWFEKIKEWDIQVLILNTGAHAVEDGEFESSLKATFKALRETYPELTVIYRDTPQGHANCEDFEEPASPNPNVPLPEWFHWDRFPHQNTLAKRIVDDSGAIFMDVSSIARNRPDGHPYMKRDCLHYCLPGPIDTWVQLLFNVFKLTLSDA